MENLEELRNAADRIKRWRREDRKVTAALVVAGDSGIVFLVKGSVIDDSEFRVEIAGWGHAAFMLIGSKAYAPEDWLKESIGRFSQSWATTDWTEALAFKFPGGDVIALWAE